MNHEVPKHIEGRPTGAEFESTWSKPPLDPSNVGPKSLQLDLTYEQELSRTPEMDVELEADENYPTEVIEEALKSASSVVKEYLRLPNSLGHQISKRNTPDRDEFTQKLCPVTRHIFRPRSSRHSTKHGDDRLYLPVNLPDGGDGLPSAFQAVETVRCDMDGLNTASNSLGGHDSWCKQEYMDLPMVALDTTTSTLVITKFRFPHSCACYLKP